MESFKYLALREKTEEKILDNVKERSKDYNESPWQNNYPVNLRKDLLRRNQ